MIKVKVPASSANLGPGFDCLGLAVELYNEFSFIDSKKKLELEGFEEKFNNEDNLVYLAFKYIYELRNVEIPNVKIIAEINVPESRGLGSSTTCIVGGMLGANKMLNNPFSYYEIFELATRMEGHPDNVAPAMYGGLSTSFMDDEQILTSEIPIKSGIKLVALIPDFTLSTEKARSVLPEIIDYKTAVRNASRAALLIAALHTGRKEHLRIATKDELHQPYRGTLIKYYDQVMTSLYETEIYGAYLSGAGPTMMAIVEENDIETIEQIKLILPNGWDMKVLNFDMKGAVVSES